MYARSLKGSIAPKGQQNIAQGNVFLRHAQRPSLLGLCHAAENVGEANALGKRISPSPPIAAPCKGNRISEGQRFLKVCTEAKLAWTLSCR